MTVIQGDSNMVNCCSFTSFQCDMIGIGFVGCLVESELELVDFRM